MSSAARLATLLVTAVFLIAVALFTWREDRARLLVIASPPPAVEAAEPARGAPPLWIEMTQRVDLNNAAAEELTILPGVGEVIAKRIVEHREAYGPFSRLEELLDVPGIGESILERVYERING